jgi:ADP-ribosylglycohydrolase
LRSGGDEERFRNSLAWRLRWWLLGAPAGVGLATLKSCVKLWLGFSSRSSGVYSAGNGPAMRAAILGAAMPDELGERPTQFIYASTYLTHTDPQAVAGAVLVQVVACLAAERPRRELSAAEFFAYTAQKAPEHWRQLPVYKNVLIAGETLAAGKTIDDLILALGLKRGVSGYIAHTVPVALFAFFRHPGDYRAAVESVIRLGGDTDTVAAITGALVGARVGKAGIPDEWLRRFADWPRSAAWMEALGRRLAEGKWLESPQPALPLAWWAIPGRNLLFFLVVLGHLGRRLLPPY